MKKKILSILLVLTMCMTMLPAASFAADEEETQTPLCSCEEHCTAGQMNADCPVCSADGALPEDCCAPENVTKEKEYIQKDQQTDNQSDSDKGSADKSVNTDDSAVSQKITESSAEDASVQNKDETQINPEEEVSLQAASGKFTLGPTELDISKDSTGNGPDGGSYTYDASTKTLTLKNYKATGKNYYKTSSNEASNIFKYYGVYIDSRNIDTLNIVLEGDNYLGDDNNLKYISNSSNLETPRTSGIIGNTVKFSGEGKLTIKTHLYPIQSGGIEVKGKKLELNVIAQMNGTVTNKMSVYEGAVVTAECKGNNLDFYGLRTREFLKINNATVTVKSKGCSYTYKNTGLKCPSALLVDGSLSVQDYGKLTVTSDGQNGGDGCQGRAVEAGTLSLQNGGSLMAYSDGYNTKSKEYDGREAVYVSTTINIDAKSSLYARTLNMAYDNNDFGNYGAIRMSKSGVWNLENSDGYNNAVITKPVDGLVDSTYNTVRIYSDAYAVKEVEILGIGSAMLTLSLDASNNKTWHYRNYNDNSTESGETKYSGDLDLKEGLDSSPKIMPRDYEGFYGIDVQKGEHTIVIDNINIFRRHTYITVRQGAILNLKLKGRSYMENIDNTTMLRSLINVEKGGMLNIIGDEKSPLSGVLTLDGTLCANPGGSISFKNCAVYSFGSIGGLFATQQDACANISVENCLINAKSYCGNLSVKNSTVISTVENAAYSDIGDLKVDPTSNVNFGTSNISTIKDWDGTSIYRTEIKLDDMKKSNNAANVKYIADLDGNVTSVILFKITGLRLKKGTNSKEYNDLSMLMTNLSETIVLWLPEGTETESVYGFTDASVSAAGFVHDRGDNDAIVTKSDNSASGTLTLRDLLMDKGILAFLGTAARDNTRLCPDYSTASKAEDWIDYDPAKEIKLQGDTKWITGFGLRVLNDLDGTTLYGSEAEVKLNNLNLTGPKQRVQLDMLAKLSLVLMDGTDNSMYADDTEAVLDLGSLSQLTIQGEAAGTGKLTLDQTDTARAIKNVDAPVEPGSLIIKNCMLINNCSDKSATRLKSLKITNSNVVGLGEIDSSEIIIDGGSIDLDVAEGTVVKDSKGTTLIKKKLKFDEKNTRIDKVVLDGLTEGTTFDDSNIITDGNGNASIWIPEGAEINQVVIGDKVYYPKSDGSMGTSEAPSFTEPSDDVSYIIKDDNDISFSVVAGGSPAPSLQWQKSTDDGKTWSDIEGAKSSEYEENGGMHLELHGVKYRCEATNESGTVYSPIFTVYYEPDMVKLERSTNRMTFGSGDSIEFTAKLDELKGVTAQYQWQSDVNVDGKTDYADIDGETGMMYHLDITDDTKSTRYRCKITLKYPNGDSKEVYTISRQIQLVKTPVIGEQPCDVTVRTGKTAEFSVKITGLYQNLTYQWQVSTDEGKNWTDIEGAGGDVYNHNTCYKIPAATLDMNGYQYRCKLNDDWDGVVSKTTVSDPVTLTVLEKRQNNLNITMDGWTYGDKANIPQYDVPSGVTSDIKYFVKNGEQLESGTPADAGDYTVTVRYETDDDIYTGTCDFTISKKPLTADMIADIADQICSGSALTPDLRVTHGNKVLEAGKDYTAAYENNTNSGKAAVTITGNGNYSGAASKDFMIKKATLTADGTPEAKAVYGTSLKDIAISGLTVSLNGTEVTGGWAFSDDAVPSAGDKVQYSAIFTPSSNSENYEELTLDIAPNISKKVINVKAEDKYSRKGDELAELTYSFEPALVGSDAFTGALATDADKDAVGTYEITQGTLALNSSYDIKFSAASYNVTRRSSSSTGSSVTHGINVVKTDNGTVSADWKAAFSGSKVTVTAEAAEGYRLSSVSVTDGNGKAIELTDNGNGKYTFTMPDSVVNIKSDFVKESSSDDNPFADIKASDYFYDAVIKANKNGIANGTDDSHFGPHISCTRAQAVTFMWRAAGSPSPKSTSMPFTDVLKGSYYYDAVLWAVENGITKGVTDTLFDPDGKCTRGQIVTFMWRSQKSPEAGTENPFTDVKDGAYYMNAVLWAVKNNITKGTSDTAFSPDDDCTRAQIVTFIDRSMN